MEIKKHKNKSYMSAVAYFPTLISAIQESRGISISKVRFWI